MPSPNLRLRTPRPSRTPRAAAIAAAISVALGAALLAGCAVGPEYKAPQPQVPQDWAQRGSADPTLSAAANVSTAPLAEDWWTVFNDPALDALMQRAGRASPDLASAALRFAQSRAQRATVAAQRGPTLDLNGAATRQRQSEYGAGTRLIDAVAQGNRDELVSVLSEPFTLYQAGFDASWELDLWGRVRRSVEAADADVGQSAALLSQMRVTVTSEVARQYFELRLAQRQLAILDQDIAAGEETLQLVQARAAGGLVDYLDVERQRTLLADLRSRHAPLRARQAAILNQIGLLVNAEPGELAGQLTAKPSAGKLTAAPALPPLALGLPGDIIRRRPDIQSAERQLQAATANIGVAIADLYPRIVLGASFGYESFQGHRLGEWGTRTWQIGPSLSIPIFDQGRRRSVIVLRELQQQEAAVAYQQAVLRAWQELDDALVAYGAERQRNAELRIKAQSSAEAYKLAQARYLGGLTDFLVQLDAERANLDARRDLADSDSSLYLRLVAIYKAAGGGAVHEAAQSAASAPPAAAVPAGSAPAARQQSGL